MVYPNAMCAYEKKKAIEFLQLFTSKASVKVDKYAKAGVYMCATYSDCQFQIV